MADIPPFLARKLTLYAYCLDTKVNSRTNIVYVETWLFLKKEVEGMHA